MYEQPYNTEPVLQPVPDIALRGNERATILSTDGQSSDFSKEFLIVSSRLFSMPSNRGQPNLARTIHKMMKATSMGMNSSI